MGRSSGRRRLRVINAPGAAEVEPSPASWRVGGQPHPGNEIVHLSCISSNVSRLGPSSRLEARFLGVGVADQVDPVGGGRRVALCKAGPPQPARTRGLAVSAASPWSFWTCFRAKRAWNYSRTWSVPGSAGRHLETESLRYPYFGFAQLQHQDANIGSLSGSGSMARATFREQMS